MKITLMLVWQIYDVWNCFEYVVAANELCRHVGFGSTTYQRSSKPSPGLCLNQNNWSNVRCNFLFPDSLLIQKMPDLNIVSIKCIILMHFSFPCCFWRDTFKFIGRVDLLTSIRSFRTLLYPRNRSMRTYRYTQRKL